jgi:heme exporter protein A
MIATAASAPTSGRAATSGRGFQGMLADRLALARGGRRLFVELSFELGAGELLLLVGANGSGKSSLLRALLGLVPLSAGTLGVGRPPRPVRPSEICRLALYQGHSPAAKPEFTALENLAAAAALDETGTDTAALASALARTGLARHHRIEMRRLSQGQKQRLQLARFALALEGGPRRLWLMDEPSAALDTEGGELLQALLSAHLADGGAAIVATHLPIRVDAGVTRELRLQPPRPAAAVDRL